MTIMSSGLQISLNKNKCTSINKLAIFLECEKENFGQQYDLYIDPENSKKYIVETQKLPQKY